jgi:hypothetical protein
MGEKALIQRPRSGKQEKAVVSQFDPSARPTSRDSMARNEHARRLRVARVHLRQAQASLAEAKRTLERAETALAAHRRMFVGEP